MFDDPDAPVYDPLAGADFIRDYYRDHFACQTCGSPDPAIIEGRWCSDCPDRAAFEAQRAARLAKEAAA